MTTDSAPLRVTGIPEIDEQHAVLVMQLERLLTYIDKGYGVAATFDAFDALFRYTQTHFRFEEDLLRKRQYPHLEKHLAEHAEIVACLKALRERFEAGEEVSEVLARSIQDWIVNHIGREDAAYADYFGNAPLEYRT